MAIPYSKDGFKICQVQAKKALSDMGHDSDWVNALELDDEVNFQTEPEVTPKAKEVSTWNVDLGPADLEEYMQKWREEISVYAKLLQASSSGQIADSGVPTSSNQNKDAEIPTLVDIEKEQMPSSQE
ncbi:hypothetical protein Dimus_030385 [Dionaea muscipula]